MSEEKEYPGVATAAVEDEWGRALYDEDGQRLTSCCGCYSTYQEGYLCCKRCYEFVPIGEGDGNEFLHEGGENDKSHAPDCPYRLKGECDCKEVEDE